MNRRLAQHGLAGQTQNFAKAGVGKDRTPLSLAARMPSPEIAAKVGAGKPPLLGGIACRVVRRNARG